MLPHLSSQMKDTFYRPATPVFSFVDQHNCLPSGSSSSSASSPLGCLFLLPNATAEGGGGAGPGAASWRIGGNRCAGKVKTKVCLVSMSCKTGGERKGRSRRGRQRGTESMRWGRCEHDTAARHVQQPSHENRKASAYTLFQRAVSTSSSVFSR